MARLDIDRKGGEPEVRFVGDGVVPREPGSEALIAQIRKLPGVRRVTALPDASAHRLEAPVSCVVELKDWVVPAIATNVMNCGIGLIDTGLMEADVSQYDVRDLIARIWQSSWSDEYLVPKDQVDSLFLEGVAGLRRMGWLTAEDTEAFEFSGSVLTKRQQSALNLDSLVPRLLRRLPDTRRVTRLYLKGNHFIELQVIDQVVDPSRLCAMGLEKGRMVLMIHMDHRVTGGTNLHYVQRKASLERPMRKRLAYFLSKAQFHFGRPKEWRHAKDRWRFYFKERGYVALPTDSPEGRRYLDAYRVGTNFGYAGRAAIYRMCMDSIRAEFGQDTPTRLVWDTNHESIRVNETPDGPVVETRKGAVQCFPGRPALIPGSYDVPSLLGECEGSDATAYSYDHGSSHMRNSFQHEEEQPQPGGPAMVRYMIPRGGGPSAVPKAETFPVRSSRPMEKLVQILKDRGAVHPVARLRPIANLSQE